jgi:hypothetical protein
VTLESLHGNVIGLALIGGWLTICFWSLALRFTNYEETPTFWRAVSAAQILLSLQLVLGLVLLVLGGRPGPRGDIGTLLFHLAYGILFPLAVLVVAHGMARAGRYNPHSVFAFAGLVNFGLAARAWQVGIFGA